MYYEFNEQVVSDARAATSSDEGLRERVRVLVMRALVDKQADPQAIKAVLRSAIAGVEGGLSLRGEQAGDALREAVKGMDEALARSVYAMRLALDEAWGQGRDFAEGDARETLSSLQALEDDLLQTLKHAADDAQGWMKGGFADLAVHLKRTGTDTGAQVRDVAQRLNSRLVAAARGSGADVKLAARATRMRLGEVASGILRGLADALDARSAPADPDQKKD